MCRHQIVVQCKDFGCEVPINWFVRKEGNFISVELNLGTLSLLLSRTLTYHPKDPLCIVQRYKYWCVGVVSSTGCDILKSDDDSGGTMQLLNLWTSAEILPSTKS